jgi:hypothetical protein
MRWNMNENVEPIHDWAINKSYHFELTRVENPQIEGGYEWVIGEFKFKEKKDIVENIFPDFFKKLDEYEPNPQKSHMSFIKSPSERSFEIRFVKNTTDKVTGFVKELERIKEEFVIKEKNSMVKVAAKYPEENKDEMHKKILQLMEENKEARQDIFFYYLMVQYSEKASSHRKAKK